VYIEKTGVIGGMDLPEKVEHSRSLLLKKTCAITAEDQFISLR